MGAGYPVLVTDRVVCCVADPLDQEVSCITEAEEDLQSSSSFCAADDATSACAAKELKTADSVIQFMKKVCRVFLCAVVLDMCAFFPYSFVVHVGKLIFVF